MNNSTKTLKKDREEGKKVTGLANLYEYYL